MSGFDIAQIVLPKRGESIKTTVASAIVAFFEQQGVTRGFGISGANIEILFDELVRSPLITPILAGHESMAGMMAIGAVKAGEPCGFVAVTSGGGSFNLISSLAEAYSQQIPLFVIAGSPAHCEGNCGLFQTANGLFNTPNLPAAFSAVSRWCKTLNSGEELYSVLEEGYRTITSGENPRGPAVLIVPQNVFLHYSIPEKIESNTSWFAMIPDIKVTIIPPTTIIVGAQAHRFVKVEELISLAVHLKASVVVTSDAKGLFPNDSDYYAGVVGIMGHQSAKDSIDSASTVIVIGTTLPHADRFSNDGLSSKRIYAIGEPNLCGSLGEIYLGNNYSESLKMIEQSTLPILSEFFRKYEVEEILFEGQNVYRNIAKVIQSAIVPGDSIYIDAGNCGASMVHYLRVPTGSFCDIAMGMGGMGYTFGASIGMASVSKRRSWVLAGDGAFFMHGLEIHTAIEQNLPITYLIFDNLSHGMCDHREQKLLKGSTGFNLYSTQFDGSAIGKLFSGVRSYRADSPEQLVDIFREVEDLDGVIFVSIRVPAEALVPFHALMHN